MPTPAPAFGRVPPDRPPAHWTVTFPTVPPRLHVVPPPTSSRWPSTGAVPAAAAVAAVVLTGIGLVMSESGVILWLDRWAWAAVATVASIAQLAGLFVGPPRTLWRIQTGATVAMAAGWLVLGVPDLASNHAALLTTGLAAGVLAAWNSPHRPTPGPR